MNTARATWWSSLDRLQLAGVAGLMFMGLAFVYSATNSTSSAGLVEQFQESTFGDFGAWLVRQFAFRQLVWYGVGVVAAIVASFFDYRVLCRWGMVLYWASNFMLLLVLIPGIGAVRYGARRWIDLGVFQFQPSEFAKIALIIAMAQFLSRPIEELRRPWMFTRALLLMAVPFLLIMKEPDLGSALVLIPIALTMMLAAGMSKRKIVWLVGGVALVGALLVVDVLFAPPGWQIKLQDYQRRRLLVYFGAPYAPPGTSTAERARLREQQRNDSHNVRQALISVGSGGLTGKGWKQGTQNSLGYLPRAVAHNDFIFSVIAEESGFVGSVIVLTLYGVVLFTGMRTAGEARDRLGQLLAVGVVTLFFSQVFINIGMNIRIMPVTGVPLPLLSYGGTSVITSLAALGLLQNIHLNRRNY